MVSIAFLPWTVIIDILMNEGHDKINPELASTLYKEVCNNIRTTDEISFKLLGLVPLVSGAGIFGISVDKEFALSQFTMIISFFAAVVTIAIFIWELRNISLCEWYRDCAKKLELTIFNQPNGQFAGMPNTKIIRKTIAEWIIYVVTIFAWIALGITLLIA